MSLSRPSTPLNILDLNDDVFEDILSYLSFDDIAKIRLVALVLKLMFYYLYLLPNSFV